MRKGNDREKNLFIDGERRERGRRSSAREGESYLSTKWGYAR
jgi:hypothetical protein